VATVRLRAGVGVAGAPAASLRAAASDTITVSWSLVTLRRASSTSVTASRTSSCVPVLENDSVCLTT